MSAHWKKYLENQVKTANPVQLTIMAYEKSILNVKMAAEKIREKDYDAATPLLKRVEAIMEELKLQLNPEADEAMVNNLFRLYDYVIVQVRVMDGAKIADKENTIVEVLNNLLQAYREVLKNA